MSNPSTAKKNPHNWLNPLLFRYSKRFFEICDLNSTPLLISSKCQAILTSEWTTKLPLLQTLSPAQHAASILSDAVQKLPVNTNISIVDFCSGAGGPIPTIERLVNAARKESDLVPIPFVMSDIKPNVPAWEKAVRGSRNLSFVAESVDATDPPEAVVSAKRTDRAVFRVYCLAFHHFDDGLAAKVLQSTLGTADGFAIIELQDRRVASLLLMGLHFFLVWVTTWIWFWRDVGLLLLTYPIPIMPFVMAFDGIVSGFRTREFGEVMGLMGERVHIEDVGEDGMKRGKLDLGEGKGIWRFEGGRRRHTWPFGHVNWIVGVRSDNSELLEP